MYSQRIPISVPTRTGQVSLTVLELASEKERVRGPPRPPSLCAQAYVIVMGPLDEMVAVVVYFMLAPQVQHPVDVIPYATDVMP